MPTYASAYKNQKLRAKTRENSHSSDGRKFDASTETKAVVKIPKPSITSTTKPNTSNLPS